MHLTRYPSRIQASGSDQELTWLEDVLTFSVKGKHKANQWVSLRLWNKRQEFPSGLLPFVMKRAKREGIVATIEDAREPLPPPDAGLLDFLLIPLRDDQRSVVERAVKMEQVIIEATTGAGKGNMIVAIAQTLAIRWAVFAPSNQLINDLYDRFKSVAGREVGRLTADIDDIRDITIFSWDKLNVIKKTNPERLLEILSSFRGVIVDECHTCGSELRALILRCCINARHRYGLSATPEGRTDGRTPVVVGLLGPLAIRVEYEELLARKAVAKTIVNMVVFEHTAPEDRHAYRHLYTANIQNNTKRNTLVKRLTAMAEKPVMVFGTRINHLLKLHHSLQAEGMNAELAYGKTPDLVRKRLITELNEGRYDALVCSDIFKQGIDTPHLSSIVLADAGVSEVVTVQRPGRAMRPATDECIIYDVYDVGWKKDDGTPRAFERQAIKRIKHYMKRGYEVRVVHYDAKTNTLVEHGKKAKKKRRVPENQLALPLEDPG